MNTNDEFMKVCGIISTLYSNMVIYNGNHEFLVIDTGDKITLQKSPSGWSIKFNRNTYPMGTFMDVFKNYVADYRKQKIIDMFTNGKIEDDSFEYNGKTFQFTNNVIHRHGKGSYWFISLYETVNFDDILKFMNN